MAKAYFCQEWIVSVKSGIYYKEIGAVPVIYP